MKNEFYHRLALYYDEIFPLDPFMTKFILSTFNESTKNKSVLDIGCATGELIISLSDHFGQCTGIDLDSMMMSLAAKKVSLSGRNIEFLEINMLELGKQFPENSVDCITCFGNTLVHLPSPDEFLELFRQIRCILKPEGCFLMQVLNYDKIIRENITVLPVIETGNVLFFRYYKDLEPGNQFVFHGTIKDKSDGSVYESNTFLYPLTRQELEELFMKSSFVSYRLYGNFERALLNSDSLVLVAEAR